MPATGSLQDVGSAGRWGVQAGSLSALSDVIDSSAGAEQATARPATERQATKVGKRGLMWVANVPLIPIRSRSCADRDLKFLELRHFRHNASGAATLADFSPVFRTAGEDPPP